MVGRPQAQHVRSAEPSLADPSVAPDSAVSVSFGRATSDAARQGPHSAERTERLDYDDSAPCSGRQVANPDSAAVALLTGSRTSISRKSRKVLAIERQATGGCHGGASRPRFEHRATLYPAIRMRANQFPPMLKNPAFVPQHRKLIDDVLKQTDRFFNTSCRVRSLQRFASRRPRIHRRLEARSQAVGS